MVKSVIDPDSDDAEPSRAESLIDAKEQQAKPRRRLSVPVVNFWLDASLLVVLCTLGWLTATLQIVFPAPTAADGWTLWGLSYDQWRDVQFVLLSLLALDVVLHVMMHWNWVCSVIAVQILHRRTRRTKGCRRFTVSGH